MYVSLAGISSKSYTYEDTKTISTLLERPKKGLIAYLSDEPVVSVIYDTSFFREYILEKINTLDKNPTSLSSKADLEYWFLVLNVFDSYSGDIDYKNFVSQVELKVRDTENLSSYEGKTSSWMRGLMRNLLDEGSVYLIDSSGNVYKNIVFEVFRGGNELDMFENTLYSLENGRVIEYTSSL